MKKKFDKVYQFKIELQEIKPPIWRRIQVPETYTFWDLHVAIQDSMGWTDSHLHEFVIKNPKTRRKINIGFPDEDFGRKVSEGWKKNIADLFIHGDTKKRACPRKPLILLGVPSGIRTRVTALKVCSRQFKKMAPGKGLGKTSSY